MSARQRENQMSSDSPKGLWSSIWSTLASWPTV